MSNTVEKIGVTVASGEFLVGVLANGFIGIMNCMDWLKTRKISPLNFILTSLAIFRTGLLGILTSHVFFISFYYSSYTFSKLKNLNIIWTLANNVCAWFSACLSAVYFFKIANFSHPIFLWLKWRINRGVLGVLLSCCFFSFFFFLTVTLMNETYQAINLGNKTILNQKIQECKPHIFLLLIFFAIGDMTPFVLSLIFCFLLILSLWRHIWKMQLNTKSSRDPSTEAHVKVLISMVSFLFLSVLYYVGMILIFSNVSVSKRKHCVLFILITMTIYPMAHSIVLIVGHSKLRLTALKVLWKLRICCKS
ncbi:LOW QUALITY PROTEIN: taste receptor type 2 member 7-like [Sarcophilus harrisii]